MSHPNENNLYLNSAALYDLDSWPLELLNQEIPFCSKYHAGATLSVLDVACGTGRLSIAFAERGFDVVGLDLSEPMIAEFYEKKAQLAPSIQDRLAVVKGDMADFDLGRKFPLIVLLWRSFQCLLTEREQRGCLRSIHRHLAENGVFIMDVFKGARRMEKKWTYSERTSTFTDARTGRNVVKRHRATTDVQNQLIHLNVHFTVIGAGNGTIEANERSCIKYYLPRQLRRLLKSEGFFIQDEFGDYDGRPLHAGDEMLVVCRRASDVGMMNRLAHPIRRLGVVRLAQRMTRRLRTFVLNAHVMIYVSSCDLEMLAFGGESGRWLFGTL